MIIETIFKIACGEESGFCYSEVFNKFYPVNIHLIFNGLEWLVLAFLGGLVLYLITKRRKNA